MDLHHELLEPGLRLIAAAVCGGLVGWDRERKHRPAGLRTLALVSTGAAVFCVLGQRVYAGLGDETGTGRILAGIVGGVGFLGAGVIIQAGAAVRGVTTAAAIWVTAGLGSACGLGHFPVALLGVAIAMMILWLSPVEKRVFGDDEADRGADGGEANRVATDQAARQGRAQPP